MVGAPERRSPGEQLFKQVHPNSGVFCIRVQLAGHRLVSVYAAQRLRRGDLQHQDLVFPQRFFRHPVAGLMMSASAASVVVFTPVVALISLFDAHGIYTVVVSLVDHLPECRPVR